MQQNISQWLGLARSLVMYYADPFKLQRMQRFYAQLIRPGDLCFDIGAHVGNRLWAWNRLGAQVIALEPQPLCYRLLQRWYGQRPNITLLPEAVGATPGSATLWISERTPTVSTLSASWIDDVRQADSFSSVQWQSQVTVTVTTLDGLIAQYGAPAFCKIDVEGFEDEVLQGLSQPLAALSFEYLPATKERAMQCLTHLQTLGDYRYNWSIGERHRWESPEWIEADAIEGLLQTLAPTDPSGDIYARLQ